MRWHVHDNTNDGTPIDATIEAQTEGEAKAAWYPLAGVDAHMVKPFELEATPICEACNTHGQVVWKDAWRDWYCKTCKTTV